MFFNKFINPFKRIKSNNEFVRKIMIRMVFREARRNGRLWPRQSDLIATENDFKNAIMKHELIEQMSGRASNWKNWIEFKG